MAIEQTFNYTDVSSTVYSYGRMQGMADAHPLMYTNGNLNPDFAAGTYEGLANRVITSWTSGWSLDDNWRARDCNCLRDMFNLGYRHSIEAETGR